MFEKCHIHLLKLTILYIILMILILELLKKTGLDCIWYYTLGKCFLNVRHSNIPLCSITFKDELYCIESVGYNTTCDTLKAAQEKLINYVTTGIKT